ncbi:MAG: AI-2E family transporter [Nitrospirae bacterium]|nr:AI-2E family transporter [Nitrospirota bacterium]
MNANRFYLLTLFAILAVLGYLTYQIFQPFLTPIAWAVVFCVIFYPAYAFVLKYIKVKAAASFVILLVILIIIIGPLSYIAYALVGEISDLVGRTDAIAKAVTSLSADERVVEIVRKLQPYTGLEGPSEEVIIDNARKVGKKLVEQLSSGFGNVLSMAANFVIMAFTIFFFLKDGPGFLRRIKSYLPFSEAHRDRLALQVKDMIVSTIYGGVIVAIIQGILGGAAFAILGVSSPIFWGTTMALMSFVPMLGTSVVWVPASIILLFEGAYAKGVVLILIGIFIISMVDNILKPLIIGGRTKMPTVIIFFTVLGGIRVFGLLGLVMGPLVFALFLSVIEIFRTIEGGADA